MKDIIKQLKLLTNEQHELSIEFESAADESAIIGTKEAYINAAIKLLEIAEESPEARVELDELDNLKVSCSNHIKYAFNEFGAVWPVVAYIAKDKEQQQNIELMFKS